MSSRGYFKFICFLARLVYPKARTVCETTPDEAPGVFVCNHARIRGPVMITLDFPRPHANWIIACAMDKRGCESYAFHDVLIGESRRFKPFWRLLAKAVRVALPPILENVDSVPVYHDRRAVETLKKSAEKLESGKDLVIFAESPVGHSEYVNELQRGFVDVGRYYWKKTGKKVKYYPVYVERSNRAICIGAPIEYDPELPANEQRERVCVHLQDGVDRLARGLKKHRPVTFMERRWYDAYGRYVNDFEGYWRMVESGEGLKSVPRGEEQ
ncbi:MAG: hypothetical protein J5586_06755 [Clostridia bacterium]|nr:hypothetical protein [Clostridia bacterium]